MENSRTSKVWIQYYMAEREERKKENKDESQNASVKVLMGLQIGSSI